MRIRKFRFAPSPQFRKQIRNVSSRTIHCQSRSTTNYADHHTLLKKILCSDHKERSNKRCICPSVCPSVAYVANNSRTQRHSVPKFGMKVPHLRCDSHTSFKVKRSKVKVTNRRGHTLSAKRGGTRLVIKQLTNLGQTFKNLIFKPCLQSLCFRQ